MRSILHSCMMTVSLLLLSFTAAQAQKGFFTEVKETGTRQKRSQVNQSAAYLIEMDALRTYLAASQPGTDEGIALEIPLAGQQAETFVIYETQVLAPEIAQRMPEIKTYTGRSIVSDYKIKLTLSPKGFNALLLDTKGNAIVFEKIAEDQEPNLYKSYRSEDVVTDPGNLSCGNTALINKPADRPSHIEMPANEASKAAAKFSNGSSIKRYRLAIGATGEFTNTFGSGNATMAYAAVVAYINEVNAIFEQELGVTFQLVTDQSYVFTNPATDPYADGSNVNAMLSENQTLMDGVLGSANYDIGHAFSGTTSSSGGGVAYAGVLCWPGYKAGGASDIGDETYYHRVFSIQLIAHEIGHMFSMSHSYNSNIPVCTTRELITSVEPGSGATIMSYGFTCGSDDYYSAYDGAGKKIGPFLNFHVKSLEQALAYMANYGTCFTPVAGTNAIPVIAPMTTNYTIPKSTPFTLGGTATDADSDPLSYSWEGTDISDEPVAANLTPALLTDPAHPPFFRSYPPVATGSRTFPALAAILDGTNTVRGEKLPSVAVTAHHTLTVRDGKGGVATEDVVVNIAGSGPFLVTNDPSGTYAGGTNMLVQWSVNNTDLPPVSCTLVDILLSQDGGLSFPLSVATAVPNTGSYSIVLPNITTTQARVKIMPSGSNASGNVPNIFFDISNQDFAVSTSLPVTLQSFNVQQEDKNTAALLWKTSGAVNTLGFDIEMGAAGSHFYKLDYVVSKGNRAGAQDYTYQVKNLSKGKYFFRLKQLDADGSYNYSPVRMLDFTARQAISIAPNPVQDLLKISGLSGRYKIVLSNTLGQVMFTVVTGQLTQYTLNMADYPAGIYIVSVSGDDGSLSTRKIVKE